MNFVQMMHTAGGYNIMKKIYTNISWQIYRGQWILHIFDIPGALFHIHVICYILLSPLSDEATFNVNNQRGSSMLAETFGRPEGFTFSMAVPNLPFTPISPASASIFLFPTAKSNTALTPSQGRRAHIFILFFLV